MSHENIRAIVRESVEVTVRLSDLIDLLHDRDRLHELAKNRGAISDWCVQAGKEYGPDVPIDNEVEGSITGGAEPEDSAAFDEAARDQGPPMETVSRLPIGQIILTRAQEEFLAPPKVPAFVRDKGGGSPAGERNVKRWTSKFTPNQVQLVVRMLAKGEHVITIAAQTGLSQYEIRGMAGAWRTQIKLLRELEGDAFERQMASMIRQMEASYALTKEVR